MNAKGYYWSTHGQRVHFEGNRASLRRTRWNCEIDLVDTD